MLDRCSKLNVMVEITAETIPLHADAHGVFRVAGTRVSLDSLVYAFLEGASPETIADQYDALALADIYLVLGFYLRHTAEVDQYLQEQQRAGEAIRAEWEERFPNTGLRQRLLVRKRLQSAS
jgi:uncharacterized protein (DUF433 family)